jgi:hypothetical protein
MFSLSIPAPIAYPSKHSSTTALLGYNTRFN